MKFCPDCGVPVPPESKFRPCCGLPVSPEVIPFPSQPKEDPMPAANTDKEVQDEIRRLSALPPMDQLKRLQWLSANNPGLVQKLMPTATSLAGELQRKSPDLVKQLTARLGI